MTLSVLQLNINADNFWNALIPFLTKNPFDIIMLQEVMGENTVTGNVNCKRDCFNELQKILADNYQGEFVLAERFTSSPTSYMGNAIFYKKEFLLAEKKTLTLNPSQKPFSSDAVSFESEGRSLLHLKLTTAGKTISFLTTHLAWAPTSEEHPHQTKQAAVFIDYLKTVPHPFVLSGDFNLNPQQPVIRKINMLAKNLTSAAGITNTINSETHRVKGLKTAVDYIYVTEDIVVKEFRVLEEDISDHLGLTATIEI
jgi:endonuclease/exonuclease/phosphatase family metal-dependent hydrolase